MWCTSIKSGPLRTSLRPSDVLVYDQRTLKRARANPAYTRATICLFVSYNTERPPGFGPPSMYWNSFVGNFVEKLHCWQTMQSPALCFLNGVANHAWGRCVLPVPWSGRDLGLELGFLQGATNDAYELGTSVAGGAVVGT
ncbi:unnamed protein product [Amoebophrya sp. A120]|nr:unnamed protein product [Amoebophrya sp. A120]|eukprot:GSA120T00015317001.1